MEDLKLLNTEQENAGALIKCARCGVEKARDDYRKVANPSICLLCYRDSRRESKLVAGTSKHQSVTENSDENGPKKQRATIHLTSFAQGILGVLALRDSVSLSEVVEKLLLRRYSEMDKTEQEFVHYVLKSR